MNHIREDKRESRRYPSETVRRWMGRGLAARVDLSLMVIATLVAFDSLATPSAVRDSAADQRVGEKGRQVQAGTSASGTSTHSKPDTVPELLVSIPLPYSSAPKYSVQNRRRVSRARHVKLSEAGLRALAGVEPKLALGIAKSSHPVRVLQRPVTLNLFDDVTVGLRPNGTSRRLDSLVITAEIDGDAGGLATFLISDDGVTGSIVAHGKRFAIQRTSEIGANVYLVEELEQAHNSACGVSQEEHATGLMLLPKLPPRKHEEEAPGVPGWPLIDVLIVYTPAAATHVDPSSAARAATLLEDAALLAEISFNVSCARGNCGAVVRVVGVERIEYAEYKDTSGSGDLRTELTRLIGTNDGFLDSVHALRSSHGADLVTLVVDSRDCTADGCTAGIARFPEFEGTASRGFNVVDVRYFGEHRAFAHEVGHNLAAKHDWYVDQSSHPAPFGYAHGYVAPDFSGLTVMSYQSKCVDRNNGEGALCPEILAFSNSVATLYDGTPLGMAGAENRPWEWADNAFTMSVLAPSVADYQPIRVGDDIYEENDEIATAVQVFDEEMWLENIPGQERGIAWDRDCYAMFVPENRRHLFIETRHSSGAGRLQFVHYDPQGTPLNSWPDLNSITLGGDEQWWAGKTTAAGLNYLCVRPIDITGNDYTFRWRTFEPISLVDLSIPVAPEVSFANVSSGQAFETRVTVSNLGENTSAPTELHVYRGNHADPESWPGGTELAVVQVPPIAAGESTQFTIPVSWPTSFPNVHWLGACVDRAGSSEPVTDLENNCSPGTPLRQRQELGTCQSWSWGLTIDPELEEGVSSWPIEVVAPGGVVADIKFEAEGEHSDLSDLTFSVVDPYGNRVTVFSNQCPGSSGQFRFEIDDDSGNSYGSWPCPPVGDRGQPLESLAVFDGLLADGTWRVEVEEAAGGGNGKLWQLDLEVCLESAGGGSRFDPQGCINDVDQDGVSACVDCNDTIQSVWSIPDEPSMFFTETARAEWTEPVELGGEPGSVHYAVLRSLSPTDSEAAVCLSGELSHFIDADDPAPGELFYYAVGASNACGGVFGNSSDGDPRWAGVNCTTGICGDGVHGLDEGCDDGNEVNGDGCSSQCVRELVVPSGFSVDLLLENDGTLPWIEAVRNPDYGTGAIIASVDGGVLSIRRVHEGGVDLVATQAVEGGRTALDLVFDATGLYSNHLFLAMTRDTDQEGGADTTDIVRVLPSGELITEVSIGGPATPVATRLAFTDGNGGYSAGAYLIDLHGGGGRNLLHLDPEFTVTSLASNSLPSGRSDHDLGGIEFDTSGVYGGQLLVADCDPDNDDVAAVYRLEPSLTWTPLTPEDAATTVCYGDLGVSSSGLLGQQAYAVDKVGDAIITVSAAGERLVFASGFNGLTSITVGEDGSSIYAIDQTGVYKISAAGFRRAKRQ